jgi:hypothetical protein
VDVAVHAHRTHAGSPPGGARYRARRRERDQTRSGRGGGVETVGAAATDVEDHELTPFDALHLVESDGDTIVSSDATYDGCAERLDLRNVDRE